MAWSRRVLVWRHSDKLRNYGFRFVNNVMLHALLL